MDDKPFVEEKEVCRHWVSYLVIQMESIYGILHVIFFLYM